MSGQLWSVNARGGYFYADELSDYMRLEVTPIVKFRQLCDAEDASTKQLHRGENYTWNVYSKLATAGGSLAEDETMPETHFTAFPTSVTMTEYGNSVPYTGKLNNFSAHPVKELIKKNLKRDVAETLDAAAWAQFNATPVTVASASSTTAVTTEEGGCTVTNAIALGKNLVKAISDVLKERNIPPFRDDNYFCTAWPTTLRTFKNDLEAVSQYVESGFTKILNGEIGKYENIRFGEQSFIAKGGAVDSTTHTSAVADPWNGLVSDWAFFLGEDTVVEAIAIPEEIRAKIPGDYGRSRGIAWYYLGGFGLVHPGSASDSMGYTNVRVVKWESAA